MSTTKNTQEARLMTPDELAVCIKLLRDIRKWSQEQLAAISGLTVRTIQRVERGEASSLDTRRALARAFDSEDIDAFNKPYTIPSMEQIQADKEKFDREHITLKATPLSTGRQLAKLSESCTMDLSEPAFEMSREAEEEFAKLVDYFRDYRDLADTFSETQKLDVYDDLQRHIDTLKALGVSLCSATRTMQVRWGPDADVKPMPTDVLYVVCFPFGKEPEQFATPRTGQIRL